jgi:hypothetical protein
MMTNSNAPLINTPLQRGARGRFEQSNRFNGFTANFETAETVLFHPRPSVTPLKRGVNKSHRQQCFEIREGSMKRGRRCGNERRPWRTEDGL